MLAMLLVGPAFAVEERYDYDALGRLVRVIDEQGRVTVYTYDAAGNILSVTVSGAGTAQPPVVNTFTPTSLRRGETKAFTITGTGLIGANVRTTDPGLDISGVVVSATQISFSLTALATAALGSQTISISNAGGSTSVQISVNPVLPKLTMSPQPIALPPGATRSFFVALSSPDNLDHTVALASSNPAVVTVSPASVTFTAGQTERLVSVTGHSAGLASINLSAPGLVATSVPVFVTAQFTGLTTSFAPMLGVTREAAPGSTSTTLTPFVAPLVGIAKGAFIESVAPAGLTIGTGPADLVVSGADLGGVTGATITPSDGLTLGSISVAPDGRSVTIPVTVAANAATTPRRVTLAGTSQPYIAARPGADQFLVTLPPPEVQSIDPIFAVTGTTAMTLTVRGRNLQGAQSVALTPATGIAVSSTPQVDANGVLRVALTVSPLAPAGPRVVTVTTPGGTSSAAPSAANIFTVVNEVQAVHTPITSANVGVVKQDAQAPQNEARGLFASAVGVIVPPAVVGISPSLGIIGDTVNLTVHGFGLAGVTAVQLSPPDGVTVGALSVGPDGNTVSVPLTIAASAPQTLRTVRVLAGSVNLAFADPGAALFRVSAPLPQLDSMSPIVLQVGAPAVTLRIVGRNFQNATAVRVEPAQGLTLSPPTITDGGTRASLSISAAASAALGPRAVIVVTPAGESSSAQSAANTLTLVNTIQGDVTPVVSQPVGVVLQTAEAPVQKTIGPFVAAAVGVVLEDGNAPPMREDAVRANLVVAVGPFATGLQVPPLTPNASATLVISGLDLFDVTAVQIEPAANIVVGPLSIAPDGRQVSAPLTLTGAADGLRGVRVLRGAQRVEFVPPYANTFRIGVGVPSIDSITPILESRGRTFTMILRGQNFQGASAVSATPATGLAIDDIPSVNNAGTEVTVRIAVDANAPLGPRVMRVHTPGGVTAADAVPANTFTVLD